MSAQHDVGTAAAAGQMQRHHDGAAQPHERAERMQSDRIADDVVGGIGVCRGGQCHGGHRRERENQ